jgi:hypothetical protein
MKSVLFMLDPLIPAVSASFLDSTQVRHWSVIETVI